MDPVITFLHTPFLGTPAWLWLAFMGIEVTLLALDLGILHKEQREIGVRESQTRDSAAVASGPA